MMIFKKSKVFDCMMDLITLERWKSKHRIKGLENYLLNLSADDSEMSKETRKEARKEARLFFEPAIQVFKKPEIRYEGDMHCYWRGIKLIDDKQGYSVRSALATQNAKVHIWIDEDNDSDYEKAVCKFSKYVSGYESNVSFKRYKPRILAKGTSFENSELLSRKDDLGYVNSDLAKALILFQYGGIFFDLDNLILRGIGDLKNNFLFSAGLTKQVTGGMIGFKKKSPIALKLLKTMSSIDPKDKSKDWGKHAYSAIAKDVEVYPCVYFCPAWINFGGPNLGRYKKHLPYGRYFFEESKIEDIRYVEGFYTYHWHNAWNEEIHPNSFFMKIINKLGINIK